MSENPNPFISQLYMLQTPEPAEAAHVEWLLRELSNLSSPAILGNNEFARHFWPPVTVDTDGELLFLALSDYLNNPDEEECWDKVDIRMRPVIIAALAGIRAVREQTERKFEAKQRAANA